VAISFLGLLRRPECIKDEVSNISTPSRGGDEGEGVGNIFIAKHPHPNPPPSMGRELFEDHDEEHRLILS
jgi:hypothetical protein